MFVIADAICSQLAQPTVASPELLQLLGPRSILYDCMRGLLSACQSQPAESCQPDVDTVEPGYRGFGVEYVSGRSFPNLDSSRVVHRLFDGEPLEHHCRFH